MLWSLRFGADGLCLAAGVMDDPRSGPSALVLFVPLRLEGEMRDGLSALAPLDPLRLADLSLGK